jgi:hypothetical protein
MSNVQLGASACDMQLWLELAKFFGQALVIVLGWLVVHQLSRSRDREDSFRKYLIDEVSELNESLESIFDVVIDYHTTSRSLRVEQRIKLMLGAFSSRTETVARESPELLSGHRLRKAVTYLKRSCTLHHFEDEHTAPLDLGADVLQVLAQRVSEMRDELSDARLKLLKQR